jgi:1,4-alpha-glucan branching enzyme
MKGRSFFMRKAFYDQKVFTLVTPHEYLGRQPTQQIARPSASSWGSEGYWNVWLNETNEWIYPHLNIAQTRMTELARKFPTAGGVKLRALEQAGRELLLAQASDWPFILRTGTSPDYARKRVQDHLLRFITLHEQLTTGKIDEPWLARAEATDNIFPDIDYRYWA